jgi:fumarate reductase subunit C
MSYTEFRPRWHRPRFPVFWWVRRRSYFTFVIRELTSVFVAWSVVFLLLLVQAVSQGHGAYQRFLDWSGTWWVVVLNAVTLGLVIFHAVTWFNLAPKAMAVHARGKRVPDAWITSVHYLAWVLMSAIAAWALLG